MVVLAASVTTSNGKVLFSRQFVDITQSRIESLLSAFPKLRDATTNDSTKQHTLIETTSVRYLYQKIEELFLVVITSKSSNIVEDLATLQVLSRVVPEYCSSHVTEKSVVKNGFELIFAFDEVVALGYRENVSSMETIRTFTNMESQEEIAFERQQKNQEREANDLLKRRMKEIEKDRRDRERMGLPSFSGPSSSGYGNYGSGSSYGGGGGSGGSGGGGGNVSSYNSSNAGSSDATTGYGGSTGASPSSYVSDYRKPEKKVRRGLVLGKAETSSNIMDQLEKEGEVTSEVAPNHVEAVAPLIEEPLVIEIQEQLQCSFDADGAMQSLVIMGIFAVNATREEATRVQLSVSSSDIQFRTHPNIDRELFQADNIITLKDRTKAYPLNVPIHVLKWRHQTQDDSDIPLRVGCWPTSGQQGVTFITLEYELGNGRPYELDDVIISIPIRCKDSPAVSCEQGSYHFGGDYLEWTIPYISSDNGTGSMEIEASQWEDNGDLTWMFPVTVNFTSKTPYCPLTVISANVPNGPQIPFSLTKTLVVSNFTLG